MEALAKREAVALDKIVKFISAHKYPPTIREIAALMEVKSVSTAYGYVERLKRKGYVDFEATKPRTLKVLAWIC